MDIRFLGAARTVTGSCYLLTLPKVRRSLTAGSCRRERRP